MYATPELERAKSTLRVFLRANPLLHGRAQEARIAAVAGWADTDSSAAVIAQAIRTSPNTAEICQLLTSPIGQLALQALAWEFPGWKLVFDLLPLAGQAVCQERQQGSRQVGVGAAFMVAGAVLLAYALKRA